MHIHATTAASMIIPTTTTPPTPPATGAQVGRLWIWTSIVKTTDHRKFMVYFESMKCSSGFCFVSCYCYVADNVNKQVGFHGNTPPSRKQRPLIKTALTIFQRTRCRILLLTKQTWYHSNALHAQNSELGKRYRKGSRTKNGSSAK